MQNSTSFDLERVIKDWREHVSRLPSFRAENVDELEAHLRDSISRLQTTGLSAEEAWLIAQKRLGYSDGLEREFAKINAPVRTARAITSVMVAILIGSILLQANFLFELNWGWDRLSKWPLCVLITTGLTLPTFVLLVLPMFALLRKINHELSWLMAGAAGLLIGAGIVSLLELNVPYVELPRMLRMVLIGAIAGAAGVTVYARFKLTSLTERMVKGAWMAMIGACLCGLGCHFYLVAYAWPYAHFLEKLLRAIFTPFYFALLSSWFAFPIGALLGVWLPRRVKQSKPWASFGFGFTVGAAIGTLAVLIYLGTVDMRLTDHGVFGQRLKSWEMSAQYAAAYFSFAVIPISALWVGVWAWLWNRRLNMEPSARATAGSARTVPSL